MKIAIHQPQYMPWVGYFHKMASCDLFVLLDDVQFKKNEWQHRNRIRNAQGWQWLSVPTSYRFPQKINEVQINYDTDWQAAHRKSLHMCYSHAPFYGLYASKFDEFYTQKPLTIDLLNTLSINLLASFLDIATPVEIASSFHFNDVATQRLVNICRHYSANTYLAGAGGHDYMDLTLFEKAGIRVEFQEFTPPVYNQLWCKEPKDFVGGLSAIDLICNCGANSLKVFGMKKIAGSLINE